ncbi:hypothetical protein [Streptomyces sp. NPDC050428]|uniref:hypothetical protein n=1 Tax=Streptomyces sp. NPDC050428 TaxID=3155757 RepID=UPI00343F2B50
MTATKTITVDQLIAEYAGPIADSVGLTATDYDATAGGLTNLLRDAADRLSSMDQTGEWLEEAAAELDAIARLGDGGPKTQELLKSIDSTLYEAKSDLELC